MPHAAANAATGIGKIEQVDPWISAECQQCRRKHTQFLCPGMWRVTPDIPPIILTCIWFSSCSQGQTTHGVTTHAGWRSQSLNGSIVAVLPRCKEGSPLRKSRNVAFVTMLQVAYFVLSTLIGMTLSMSLVVLLRRYGLIVLFSVRAKLKGLFFRIRLLFLACVYIIV